MAWTREQERAIQLEGCNILVSAGAGSGKTAVLTERVKRKVLDGISVKRLLVLTFTNAAAAEMKDRIRKALQKTDGLEEEANKVDGSYITTFDSFALSIVKKYHTRLNITNHVQITDQTILEIKKRKILDSIFEEYYKKPSDSFLKLIENFCLKDDKELKEAILKCYSKIELKYDKTHFIQHYFEEFNDFKIKGFIQEFEDFLKEKRDVVISLMDELSSYFDGDFVSLMMDNYSKFLNANTYDEFVVAMDYESIRVPRGSSEEGKKLKGEITASIDDFKKNYCIYSSSKEIEEELFSTKSNIEVIVSILEEFDQSFEEYKKKNNAYSFNDIARMAIEVVEENADIQKELKDSFQEILVDEYQDTSDVQEKFISLISHNNVYMVGDIKQSIYRFRNANPDIFRKKYNLYRDSDAGEKIDLLKNFRSRGEVLEDINLLFDPIMDEKIGGAAYPESHRMVFGNELYTGIGKTEQNYHMDVITYPKKELGRLRDVEEEAFLIGNDILQKIQNHVQIFDKDLKILRDVEYKDFVILLDKSTQFSLYKKIFEYLQIPLSILKDESFQNDDDSFIFRNLLKFILCVKNHLFDSTFEYCFVSLARSFLYPIEDSKIYEMMIHKNYQDTLLYQDALLLSSYVDITSPSQFIQKVFQVIPYEESIITTSNIEAKRVKEEYFYNLAKNYENLGHTIYEFVDYLEEVYEGDYDLSYNTSERSSNSCRIMTIHKSKGLEFPICYFAGYSSSFNFMELNERILFDAEYGFILPKVDGYYKDTILKILLKSRVRLEEVSEKIRLFYVATTRAKEKMIFVIPEMEEEDVEVRDVVPTYIREKYRSFYSMLESIHSLLYPYLTQSTIIGSKDYLKYREIEKIENDLKERLDIEEIHFSKKEVEEGHYSKEVLSILTKEEKEVMNFGTEVHEILELLDFANPKILDVIQNSRIKNKIQKFLNSDLMKDKLCYPMYKEYEFYDFDDGVQNHGIIDLLIEEKDSYVIVDYKLKNIDDEHYDQQLNGYRKFIEKKTGKRCRCYLYSIIGENYREV